MTSRKFASTAALAWLIACAPTLAQDRSDVESELSDLRRSIATLQQSLENARQSLGKENEALEALDHEIQKNARQRDEAQKNLNEQQQRVAGVEQRQTAFLQQLEGSQEDLARQILAAWKVSRESRMKLILNQDSPAQISRLLAYYDHLNRAQAQDISELRVVISELDLMMVELNKELAALATIQSEYTTVEERLNERREERLMLLRSLQASMSDDAARLAELEQNRADLETLIEQLDDALADIPADLGDRQHPTQKRGEIPMPVAGRVIRGFGQNRGGGLRWQGWVIGAESGEVTRAVAYGRIAYADWLRGYGLLLIVDHGEGFMSLYGQNESVTVEVGDWVEAGQPIARVGQNPDQQQGLYFELRNNGKALDPATWIKR